MSILQKILIETDKKAGIKGIALDFNPFSGYKPKKGSCSCGSRHSVDEFYKNVGNTQIFTVGGMDIAITTSGNVSINGQTVTPGTYTTSTTPRPPVTPGTSTSSSEVEDDNPIDEVKTSGGTKLIFYEGVSEQTRTSMEEALIAAKRIMNKHSLGWLLTANIYVQSSSNGGYYQSGSDEVWLTPHSDRTWITKVIVHELGHRFHYVADPTHYLNREIEERYSECYSYYGQCFPSSYSKTDAFEFWAESFSYALIGMSMDKSQKDWTMDTIRKYNRS